MHGSNSSDGSKKRGSHTGSTGVGACGEDSLLVDSAGSLDGSLDDSLDDSLDEDVEDEDALESHEQADVLVVTHTSESFWII